MRKTDTTDMKNLSLIKHRLHVFGLAIAFVASFAVAGFGHQMAWADSACSSSSSAGTYVTSVTLAKSGNYTVWAHMKAPSSSANLLLLGINGTCYPVGNSGSIPANTWAWVDYFRSSSNTVQRSFVQGTQNVTIIGASPNVKVDKIEFLSNGCTPTGDGSNCASGSQASGDSSTGGAAIAISTSPNNSGNIRIFGDGGILTPANTGIPTEISAPFVTIQPDTYSSVNNPIEEVDYSLSGKWLATVTSDPFSYRLNVRHILNGTYTLSTKITYKSGKATTTAQKLIIENPTSLTQFVLAAEHYVVYEIVAVIILIAVFILFRKWRSSKR